MAVPPGCRHFLFTSRIPEISGGDNEELAARANAPSPGAAATFGLAAAYNSSKEMEYELSGSAADVLSCTRERISGKLPYGNQAEVRIR